MKTMINLWKWSQPSELEAFEKAYERIRKDLTTGKDPNLKDAIDWYDNILKKLVKKEKSKGFTVVKAYESFAKNGELTEEKLEISRILGCCIEIIHTYFCRLDEIRRRCVTENMDPAWFLKVENIDELGVNDDSIYEILKKYCSKHENFREILDLYLTTLMHTQYGLSLSYCDLMSNGKFEKFTPEDYEIFVKYRLNFYTFDLPVRVAMLYAGLTNEEMHMAAQKILLKIGYLFQAQTDYLSCFENEDINLASDNTRDGKWSWIAVQAYNKMNESQKRIFEVNYGQINDASTKEVLKIFDDLNIKKTFMDFENEQFSEIQKEIKDFGEKFKVNTKIFNQFLQKVYTDGKLDINANVKM